jgi:hypothetical protein
MRALAFSRRHTCPCAGRGLRRLTQIPPGKDRTAWAPLKEGTVFELAQDAGSLQFMLPDAYNGPTSRTQGPVLASITPLVALDFGNPPRPACPRDLA